VALNAVQQHMKGLLDQLVLPLDMGILNAFITPPDPGDGTQAAVYIWGSTGDEKRQTMPRARPNLLSTGGFKVIVHSLDLWLIWFGSAEDPSADSQFPLVIDSVTKVLRNTLMPVDITDPDTGDLSSILAIGEDLKWDYAPVHSVEDERWLVYTARVIATIKEKLQA
jgi:hypothetical protein